MFRKLGLLLAALLLLTAQAHAAGRTEWTAGNGQGFSWSSRTTAFGTGDLTSVATGKSILSSASAITNGTSLDMFMDISIELEASCPTFFTIWSHLALYSLA